MSDHLENVCTNSFRHWSAIVDVKSGPVRKFAQTVMQVWPVALLVKHVTDEAYDWQDALYYNIVGSVKKSYHTEFRRQLNKSVGVDCVVVVLGRNATTLRWNVVSSSKFHRERTSRGQFRRTVKGSEQGGNVTHWLLVWGMDIRSPRQVVTVFNQKWMIYDTKGSVDDSQVTASRV